MESIREVEIKPIKGFKSGLIAYGTCAAQNRVVRIKLKYSDDTKAFYQKLKNRIDIPFRQNVTNTVETPFTSSSGGSVIR